MDKNMISNSANENLENSTINKWACGVVDNIPYPALVYIAPTNLCNSRCVVCPRDKTMRKEQGIMDFSLFKKIVKQLPKEVKKVYLMKQGEPFVHPQLEDFIIYLRDMRPDINISFHTNGIVAQKERVRKILSLVDSIGISISAITSDVYIKAHGVDKFDAVMHNIKDISDLLIENKNKKTPHVFIDYVEQQANESEKKEDVIAFYCKKFPGLSSVDFHWVFNFQGETEEGNLDIHHKVSSDKFPQCVFPWSAMTICHDGKVSYCFVEPRENKFLGDFNSQTFDEIWDGDEYKKFRQLMVDKKFDQLLVDGMHCKKCTWLWSMKAQSPKNMAGGYALKFNDKENSYFFGDILDMSADKKYEYALDAFLSGEIDRAMGVLMLLETCIEVSSVDNKLKQLMGKCQAVLKKYQNLNLWQDKMKEEGIDIDERKCTYHKIGDK